MQANITNISVAIRGGDLNRIIQVPRYQRPYAWEKHQCEELVQDIDAHLMGNGGMHSGDRQPYFLGSIILIRGGDQNDKNVFDILDGQQRVTTIILLSKVIRDLLRGWIGRAELRGEDPRVAQINFVSHNLNTISHKIDEYQTEGPQKIRIRLVDLQDADYLERLLNSDSENMPVPSKNDMNQYKDGQKRYFENYANLKSSLKDCVKNYAQTTNGETDLERELEYLRNFAKVVANGCELTEIITDNRELAFRVFSTINARGMDLEPIDIFKSLVFGQIPPIHLERVNNQWDELIRKIDRDDQNTFVSNLYTAIAKTFPERSLAATWEQYFIDLARNNKGGLAFWNNSIYPNLQKYVEIINGHDPRNRSEINNILGSLARLAFRDWISFSLWIFNHSDETSHFAALEKLHKICFCFVVNGTYEKTRKRILGAIFWGTDANSYSEIAQMSLATLKNSDVYTLPPNRHKFILQTVDQIVGNAPGATVNREYVHIEHILPQNPSDPEQLADGWTIVGYREAVHKLGNLAYLPAPINIGIGNSNFQAKRSAIKDRMDTNPKFATVENYGLKFPMSLEAFSNADYQNRHDAIIDRLGHWLL